MGWESSWSAVIRRRDLEASFLETLKVRLDRALNDPIKSLLTAGGVD